MNTIVMSKFIVIAHRGASGKYPENTLLAFRKALESGARWLELDVHRSADDQLVVIHDETLERTTNGRGTVTQKNLAQLRRLSAGQGEKIPLLAEVLDLAAGRATVNIELKGKGTAAPVARLLRQRIEAGGLQPAEILVSSLDEQELISFARLRSDIRVAPVADQPDQSFWELATRLGAWSVNLGKDSVSAAVVKQARQQGRKLLVYTVNDQETLMALQKLGADGVFTNEPELFNRA